MSNEESDAIDAVSWPSTVTDAAARVVALLSPAEKATLASASDDDLLTQHFGIGMQIRNTFGLWTGNTHLLDDCTRARELSNGKTETALDDTSLLLGRMDVDGASQTILLAARDLARSL